METDKKTIPSYWVVAYIDLLGQDEKMREINTIPQDKNDEKFLSLINDTFGAIKDLQNSFGGQCGIFSSPNPSANLPPGITIDDFRNMKRAIVKFQRFSDGLIVFTPLERNINNMPLNGISTILSSLSVLMPAFLAKKRPFRCGVDIGVGAELYPGELYGPAVRKAYYIESKIAQYPRIVLGSDLLDHIEQASNSKEEDIDSKVARALANIWKGNITCDLDGHPILDYLKTQFSFTTSSSGIYKMGISFILEELEKHKKAKNTKLVLRYIALYGYFLQRLEQSPLSDKEKQDILKL